MFVYIIGVKKVDMNYKFTIGKFKEVILCIWMFCRLLILFFFSIFGVL